MYKLLSHDGSLNEQVPNKAFEYGTPEPTLSLSIYIYM